MKALCAIAVVSLSLMGSVGSAQAQYGGGYGEGYREGYRERDYGDRGRGPGYDRGPPRERGYGFDEREYLRCNPDVRRAVARGQMESGLVHYRTFGRREGRQLSCR